MGKKKRGHPDLEELLARPWCYYCERDFDDLKILISHQKAKHFKCDRCGRRLNTAGGLSVHMSQVHKEQLSAVDNALPNRSSLDIEIFGMEGVPEDVLQAHNQRVITQYHQAEAERRAATGNPAPGTSTGTQSKRPKLESAAELKKRLAEHKAKLAEKAAGTSSGGATPVSTDQGLQTGSSFATPQYPPNGSVQQYPYPQQCGQPAQATAYQQPSQTFQKPPEFPSPGYQQPPVVGQQYTGQYSPSAMSPSQYQPAVAGQSPVVSTTPPVPFQQQPAHMRTHTPPQQAASIPPRPPSLPAAPGLPQRPSFSAPQVNSWQMQQMHHGQMPVQPPAPHIPGAEPGTETAAVVDRLISEESKRAEELAQRSTPTAAPEEAAEGKPAKKEKAKSVRLVYSDSGISPEEKMARLPRYAYVPERKEETVLRDATTGAVARPVDASDEIVNPPE
ncbi:hypothetical protein D8B26_003934 [Coccidioides posadasii str. Silveira]|uniref:Uncharacterized protein n=2 Tax=Coccidioides posadasii TaxID=199306 RepID=A0A0J6FL13_COCPO|nr:C2H2 type zinc finger containing protein [Coccidioides posadasii C735 delta SOWgp]EER29512.1 C2H2 type zinc finger containing protein [Coccidioides posadasii C735 delta SOWgp]KMM70100.1 hypothetical protein CPAG_06412 [Coccidioides posadasii RMSCC 3488]QVM09270.1 hypothetical protein D8B26_003934 [Coccidioides posadasii str. Silveira]|eukprot:XP_003071657.1 C2H2 type zinc finger containing protein [Coccidioides posadasii C735 delta SOWgp]